MKNFKFIKPYSTMITVGGFVGITQANYGAGVVLPLVEENSNSVILRIKPEPTGMMAALNNGNTAYQTTITVPKEYVKETSEPVTFEEVKATLTNEYNNNKPHNNQNYWDYKPVNIIFGSIVVILLYVGVSELFFNKKG